MTPRTGRVALTAVVIVVGLALQTTVFSRLPLPGNPPNILLLFVVAVGLAAGAMSGAVVGFATGLAADLLSDHPVGLLALVLLLVGYLVGTVRAPREAGVFWSLVVTAVASVGSYLGYLVISALIERHGVGWGGGLAGVPAMVLWDVMLAPFVIPVVAAEYGRTRVGARP